MSDKEATARIKINKLLEAAGWRFFPEGDAPTNIRLEPGVTIKTADLDALGDDFETTAKGFIDFLLLDSKGFPLVVLEAKAENKNPLIGKEQARKYAKSQNCRFVILSNGNLHYSWDLKRFFRDITTERLRNGVFRSVPELSAAIKEYISVHNKNPKAFIWTAKDHDILAKVIRANSRLSSKQNEALH